MGKTFLSTDGVFVLIMNVDLPNGEKEFWRPTFLVVLGRCEKWPMGLDTNHSLTKALNLSETDYFMR